MNQDELSRRLKAGDEEAFRWLVARLQPALRSVARSIVGNPATADEVVQDTWLAVIENIAAFEQRSSVKTWVFAILVNTARTRARRDGRMVSFSDYDLAGEDAPAVPPDRFDAEGMWKVYPQAWDDITPERIVGGRQVMALVAEAIEALPELQKAALLMVEDAAFDQSDAARVLDISVNHLRVLIHRARARVRAAVARALDWDDVT